MQPPRGTRDLYDKEADLFEFIRRTFIDTSASFGFKFVETPVFEQASVFNRTLGDTSDIITKEMFTLENKGDDTFTLRPEGTAPLIRSLISNGLMQNLPQKRCYFGPMFRYERPQKGRYRQFYQFGVEYVGGHAPSIDVEVIQMSFACLRALGLLDFNLHLNSLGDTESRNHYQAALVEFLEPYKNDLSPESQVRLINNPLRILDSKSHKDQEICAQAPAREKYLNLESREFFEHVCILLNGLNIPFILDASLVRGLDYYEHTVFEFKSSLLGAQDAFGGGGRYNGLIKTMGGPPTPGMGWALGVDRIMLILEGKTTPSKPQKIAVIPVGDDTVLKCLEIAELIRSNTEAIVEVCHTGNLAKKMKHAHKLDADWAVIIGSEEAQKGVSLVRAMKEVGENKEQSVASEHLKDFFKSC
jgi:histidyl-tRNA synthetase